MEELLPLSGAVKRAIMNRYNLSDQKATSWLNRAEICVSFIQRDIQTREAERVDVADLGCGDEKLERLLASRLSRVSYQGYDIIPQSRRVIALDLNRDELPRHYDFITVLGVSEYIDDLRGFLVKMAGSADRLIISHVISDAGVYDGEALTRLGWRNHLSQDQLLSLLAECGWETLDSYLEPIEKRTFLAIARSRAG
jgi:hypothetical protein